MKRLIVVFLLAFFIPTTNINAYYCKYSEIAKYKGLASNISTTYNYIETNGNVTFSITLVNLNKELYIVDTTNEKVYNYTNSEITLSGYSPGQVVKYNVYATNENCSTNLLYTIRVVLPDYNPYYNDPICSGVENYIYCQKWYGHELNHNDFVKKVNAYKQSLLTQPDIEPNIPDNYGLFSMLLSLFAKYYYVILIPIIIICGLIIYIIDKRDSIYK